MAAAVLAARRRLAAVAMVAQVALRQFLQLAAVVVVAFGQRLRCWLSTRLLVVPAAAVLRESLVRLALLVKATQGAPGLTE